MCSLLCCTSFQNILLEWISNFILLLPSTSLFSFIWIISYCPNVWIFLLTCKVDVFCNYTVDYEALCMPSFLFLHHPNLFYYLDSSCLLKSLNYWLLSLGYLDFGAIWWFNSLSLSLINRSMKSRILATYPDAFPDDSTGEVVDRRLDLEIPQ